MKTTCTVLMFLLFSLLSLVSTDRIVNAHPACDSPNWLSQSCLDSTVAVSHHESTANATTFESGLLAAYREVRVSDLPSAQQSSEIRGAPFLSVGHLPRMQNNDGIKEQSNLNEPVMAANVPQQTTVNLGFDGIHKGCNGLVCSNGAPPDVQLDVGPNHVMEMVNFVGEIWNKQGSSVKTFTLKSFYNTGTDFIFDPRVLYDTISGVWFASIADSNSSSVLVAVSTSNDPTASWWIYQFSATAGTCADQPIIAVSNDKLVISTNNFNGLCGNTGIYIGAQYWIVNKTEMLTGSSVHYFYHGPDNTLFAVHPVQSLGSTDTQFMVSVGSSGASSVQLFSVTGTPPATPQQTSVSIPIGATSLPPAAVQPGTTHTLDVDDERVTDAMWYNGKLWFSFTDSCTPSGDTQARSCVHMVQIDTSTNSLNQNFQYGLAGKYLFYPAVRESRAGNVYVVFGYSSSTDYPGIMVTVQAVGDPPNTIESPIILQSGTGFDTSWCPQDRSPRCRYGDYFGAGVDSSAQDAVWVAGEYGRAVTGSCTITLSCGWGTYIGKIGIAPTAFALTVSYSVQGGGTGYVSPVLTYLYTGAQQRVTVTNTPTQYNIDPGTSWSITNPLDGSSSVERWQTNQLTSGTITASQALILLYYHQFYVTFNYNIVNGGSGYAVPTVAYAQFGTQVSSGAGSSAWVDADSTYTYQNQLSGSTTTERWITSSPSGSVSISTTVSAQYYHQYLTSISYSVVGGGNPGSGTLSSVSLGASLVQTIGSTPQGVWIDSGAAYTITNPLPGSTTNERWHTAGTTSGTVSSAITISLVYYHQYMTSVSYIIVGGGSPIPPTLSFTSFGGATSTALSTTVASLWLDGGTTYSIEALLAGSTQSERWATNAATSGTISGPSVINQVYYHQFWITASYAVVGGGSPAAPTFFYTLFGATNTLSLNGQIPNFWADSGPYSATNPLGGSTSTERWYSSAASGSISAPGDTVIAFYHQFYLTVTGGNLQSEWYNSGSTAALTPSGVFGRSAGTGFRITSYSIDRGATTPVAPTTGVVNISIVMNDPHALAISSVTQYEVNLGSGSQEAVNFITAPTITNDNYWYDSGSAVNVTLNGVWNRAAGAGNRLLSYSVNGGAAPPIATAGKVTVLAIPSISSPQSITATTTSQYELTTQTGSIAKITPTPIVGDKGWYDVGTPIRADYNYSWNETTIGSRLNAIGYRLDQGQPTTLSRVGKGTFSVEITMDKPHSIDINAIRQYLFSVRGGFDTKVSSNSPTDDGFYDAESFLTVTTDYTWNVFDNKSRENLASYMLDEQLVDVTRAESGTFTTPQITFNQQHQLVFNSVTQFFLSFGFTDNSGSRNITPTDFSIEVEHVGVVNVKNFKIWLDNGATFRIATLTWENSNVRPTNLTVTVSAPLNETVRSRIFDAKLRVTDYLGVSISGADTLIHLANGTRLSRSTGGDGTITIPMIPFGTFDATISYLGTSTQVSGDASIQRVTDAKVFVSYPDLGALGGGIAAVIIPIVFRFIIRKPEIATAP